MGYLSLIFILLFHAHPAWSQDLMGEKIRRITPIKKSIFLESGVFHNGNVKSDSTLNNVRHSFSSSQGYERVVFDFKTRTVPRIYGHMSPQKRKLFIDFFETDIADKVASLGKSKFVEKIDFFPVAKDLLSVELSFKEKVSVDMFFLEGPGRFVLDIKN